MAEFLISEFQHNYEKLISTLKEEEICIFLGAGISEILGYPSWKQLVKNLTDAFWKRRNEIKKKIIERTTKEYLITMQPKESLEFLYTLSIDIFYEEIEKFFNNNICCSSKDGVHRIYKHLTKINNSEIYITTNIDKELQNFLKLRDEEIAICPNFCTPPKKLNYIHGRIDKRDSWILTSSQYEKIYLEDNKLSDFLNYIFETYNVLFIEYSLEEEIRNILYKVNNKKLYFWTEAYYRGRAEELEIKSTNLEKYNIKIIPYNLEVYDKLEALEKLLEYLENNL